VELGKFVTDTLVQVIRGVQEAQEKVGQGLVNPRDLMTQADGSPKTHYKAGHALVHMIEFDVAISVNDSVAGQSVGAVSVLGANVGGKGSLGAEHSTATRIRFEVPVLLPKGQHA
jgi:hypothetical protein